MWPWNFRRTIKPEAPHLLLAWWGAFPGGGGATLGDYHAVMNVWRWLRDNGVSADIMNETVAAFDGVPTVRSGPYSGGVYSGLIFACGPLVLTRGMRRLLRRFRQIRKVAVGVSLIEGSAASRDFDRVVARDSSSGVSFDLALAYADDAPRRFSSSQQMAVCLRGPQKTYGRENCLDARVDAFLKAYATDNGIAYRNIDTILRPDNGTKEIEEAIATSSLLVTTRMHGALFALAARTPFVAIDQIVGGAKVSRLMEAVGWRWAYRADHPDAEAWRRAVDTLRESGWTDEMEAIRARGLTLSQRALDLCGKAIVETLVVENREALSG